MKKVKWNKWKGWLGSSLLATLLVPSLYPQADLLRLTQERMIKLAEVIEVVFEQTGAYPEKLEPKPWLGELQLEGDAPVLHDAWRKPFVYCKRKRGKEDDAGEYWLGSSCGQPEFGGFLRYMTGQTDEAKDLVMRNGRFLSSPGILNETPSDYS